MTTRRIILLILLTAALGFAVSIYWPLLSPYFSRAPVKPPPVVKLKEGEPSEEIAREKEEVREEKLAVEKVLEEEKKKLVDPFSLRIPVKTKKEIAEQKAKVVEKPVEKPKEPKLEGIWVDSGMRVAFISGQALIEGGTIMGWRVQRITKTYVVLVKKGARKVLKLEGQVYE